MNFTKFRRGLAVVMLGGLTLMTQGALAQARSIPDPDLSALTPEGRAILTRAVGHFEAERDDLSGAELGVAYGRLGLHLMAQGQLESAFAALGHASELDNANFRWPYFRGLTQAYVGNNAGAVPFFGEALKRQPDNTVVATRLGLALIDEDKLDSARNILEAVTRDPGSRTATAVAGLGRIALQGGDAQKALSLYKAALILDPGATRLNSAIATAYDALGDADAAKQAREQAGDRLPTFADPLVALLEAHRKPANHWVSQGDKARDAGLPEQAALSYDIAMAVDPQDGTAQSRLAELRRSVRAERAQSAQPESADDFFQRGVFFAAQGDDSKAIEDFEAALTRDADNVAARVFLANALMRVNRYGDAAERYAQASERDEKSVELRYRTGIAWIAAKRCEQAEAVLLTAYDMDNTQIRVIQAISRVYATCPVADTKRRTALQFAEFLYNSQPTLETAETLAMVLAANGRFEEAADYQRQAIFEALKSGVSTEDSPLARNLERYVASQPSLKAWPEDHPIFRPAPPSADAAPQG